MGVGGASKLDNLTQMVAGVMDDDAAVQTEYVTQFRMLLSVEKGDLPFNWHRPSSI